MRTESSPCAEAAKCASRPGSYRPAMAASQVERLLRDIEMDRVVPERYSRKSFSSRIAPVVLLCCLAVGAVVLGILLGRL